MADAPDAPADEARAAYIREIVEQAPPLSAAQRSELGAVLRSATRRKAAECDPTADRRSA